MTKLKKQKKPKSKQRLRLAKKRVARSLKSLQKRTAIPKIIPFQESDADFLAVIKSPLGLRDFDPNDNRFNGVDPYAFTLQKFQWLGLITLKFHSLSYSKDDFRGDGRKNRFDFLAHFMENLSNTKFRIKPSELNWVACEEFGFSGAGHLHVLISFDYLKQKGREDKIPKFDFSENGQFYQEGREAVGFVCRKLRVNPSSVDFNWRPMWKNEGLVNYFSKNEFGRVEKFFRFSQYWEIHENLKAA